MPLAVAVFLWNVFEAMVQGFAGTQLGSYRLPRWLATILGIAAVLLGLYLCLLRTPGTGGCRFGRVAALRRSL